MDAIRNFMGQAVAEFNNWAQQNSGTIAPLLVIGFLLCLFFFPTLVAMMRRHLNAMPIFIINLVFGWTVLGWIVCLAWSFSSNVPQRPRYSRQ